MRGRFSPKGLTEVDAMAGRGVGAAVDLRTDAATRPTPEMRRAMMAAEVGDDAYGEDPSVRRLETRAADLLGKEAALFVPSGTMGNQIAIHLHARPGQEVICDERSHVFNLELAMMAVFSGVQARPVGADSGRLSWGLVQPALRSAATGREPSTGVVVVENTLAAAGGVPSPAVMLDDLARGLRPLGIPVHLDGARLFNAAAALETPVSALAAGADSVMICLSKGLGAPVGSLLCGASAWIERARTVRQMLGGGMRQAGVLAAAGLVALERSPERLPEDHRLAQLLADGAAAIAGVQSSKPATNIVLLDVSATEFDAAHVSARLAERNVLVHALDACRLRLVTHSGLDQAACEEALFALRAVIERE